jgi:hypothetical protein
MRPLTNMSYSFYIRTDLRPAVADVLARIDFPDVVAPDAGGAWPDGTLHIYRAEISTRATEITYEDHAFQVRILAMSSPEDYELAFRVVEHLAALTGSQVESEDDDTFPAEMLRDIYDAKWVKRMTDSQPTIIGHFAKDKGDVVTIEGPVRDFHIGPRLYAELEADGPADGLPQRILEAIRRTQYRDLSGYDKAAIIEATTPDNSKTIRLSVWNLDRATHFSGVGYLRLVSKNMPDDIFLVPYEALPQLAGKRFAWLDERQCLVEAIASDERSELLREAERFKVTPFELLR